MSENDVALRGLVDIRLPGMTDAAIWGELLFALGIGLVAALLIGTLLSFVTRKRVAREPDIAARLAMARDLPQEARLVALARLARETGVRLPEDARRALYRPDERVDLDELEAAVAGR